MKLKGIHLAAVGIAITALSAHAQTTVRDFDRNGNLDSSKTTYADGSTYTTFYYRDRNGNEDLVRTTHTDPTVVRAPAPTPTPVYYHRPEVNYFPTSNVPTPVVQPKIIVYQSDGTTHTDSQVGGVVVPSITGNRWTPDALIVSGTLTNTSAVAVKITGIDAKGFNESQKMVIGGSDFSIVHNDLAPGETVNFKIALKDTTKQVKFVKVTPSWLP